MRNKIISSAAVILVLTLLVSMTGCGGSIPGIMDSGAAHFAEGKQEDNYSMKNSGALLQSLIDQYSGSYRVPDSSQMDDDDFDDAKKQTGDGDLQDPTGDGTAPPAPDDIIEVGSWDDLIQAFYGAYADSETYLEFELVGGFTMNPSEDLQESYNELQRMDPVYVSCVSEWRWGCRGTNYIFEIGYTIDPDELNRIKDDTARYLETALDSIDTTGMSDYEIVCAVNEYLCDTVYYPDREPYAPLTHTAYGALANGEAVCEGYACAAKILLNKLGIPCDIQFGTCTDGGGHAWNLVQLEGQWYQMDVTWNDGSADRTDYLLVTDEYMRKSRTWDENDYPACADTAYKP